MNMILKSGFTIALFAICVLGLSAMTAEPALAIPNCPANECAIGESENMTDIGPCELWVAGSYWSDCRIYSSPSVGRLSYTCYCDCFH